MEESKNYTVLLETLASQLYVAHVTSPLSKAKAGAIHAFCFDGVYEVTDYSSADFVVIAIIEGHHDVVYSDWDDA